jgi:hypothetical protein
MAAVATQILVATQDRHDLSNALLYPSASSSFTFGNPLVVKNGAHLGEDIGEDVIEDVYYRNPLGMVRKALCMLKTALCACCCIFDSTLFPLVLRTPPPVREKQSSDCPMIDLLP